MLQFEVISILSGGKTSLIYKAHDIDLNRTVTIKEYLPVGIASRSSNFQVKALPGREEQFQQGLKRFILEGKTMAKFCHPVFREIQQLVTNNGTAYMILPYYEGNTIRRMVQDGWRAKDWGDIFSFVLPILTGISLLHKEKYCHCDISPSNVLIRDDFVPVLLDFGAVQLQGNVKGDRPATDFAQGFAAKEQYDANGIIGAWTDIYSISALIYYMVTGIIPNSSISRVVHDSMRPLASFSSANFPSEVLKVIDTGFSVEPHHRFVNVGSFAMALKEAAEKTVQQSGAPLAREMLSVEQTVSTYSAQQREMLKSSWGLRELLQSIDESSQL